MAANSNDHNEIIYSVPHREILSQNYDMPQEAGNSRARVEMKTFGRSATPKTSDSMVLNTVY